MYNSRFFHDFLPNYNYKAVWSTRYSLGPRSMKFIQYENDRSDRHLGLWLNISFGSLSVRSVVSLRLLDDVFA